MRGRTSALFCAALLVATVGAVGFSPQPAGASTHYFIASGQISCTDPALGTYPLAGARVEMWNARWPGITRGGDTVSDDMLGSSHTDATGHFSFYGYRGDVADMYLRFVLNDDQGVKLQNDWQSEESISSFHFARIVHVDEGPVDWGSFVMAPSRIGDVSTFNRECAVWTGAKRSYDAFRCELGTTPPAGHYTTEMTGIVTFGGVPFTAPGPGGLEFGTTYWPTTFPVAPVLDQRLRGACGQTNLPVTSDHEFAHTLRHALDGGVGHFLSDVVSYTYLQNHHPYLLTNPGFAFNEGWAEYWSDDAHQFGDGTNMSYEGNVATALQSLATHCPEFGPIDNQRSAMFRVLEAGRDPQSGVSKIHSYAEFLQQYQALYPDCPRDVQPISTPASVDQQPQTRREMVNNLNIQIAAERSYMGDVRKLRRTAYYNSLKLRRNCIPSPCGATFATRISVPLFDLSIAQAQLVVASLTNERRQSDQPTSRAATVAFYQDLGTSQADFRQADLQLGEQALVQALAAVQPLVDTDRTNESATSASILEARLQDVRDALGSPDLAIPAWLGPEPLHDDTVTTVSPTISVEQITYPTTGSGTEEVLISGTGFTPGQPASGAVTPLDGPSPLCDSPGDGGTCTATTTAGSDGTAIFTVDIPNVSAGCPPNIRIDATDNYTGQPSNEITTGPGFCVI